MTFGRYFEEFVVGGTVRHWPGRTISEADDTWFSLITQNQNPLHIDSNYALNHTQHGRCLVNGILILAIAVGQSVADISGRAIANLGYEEVTHDGPTFHGDTIYSATTILDKKESSRGDRGVVHVQTTVVNQRQEQVMSFKRHLLAPMRNHATLGEGRLPV